MRGSLSTMSEFLSTIRGSLSTMSEFLSTIRGSLSTMSETTKNHYNHWVRSSLKV
jgi:hypothetical protein